MEPCPECGSQLIPSGGCIYCPVCGFSTCCCEVCTSQDEKREILTINERGTT